MGLKQLTSIPIIDAHVHLFPPGLDEAVRRWFDEHAWSFKYRGRGEDLVSHLFQEGVSGAVLMSYSHRPGIAEGLNEFTASVVQRFPNTAGMAALHPEDRSPRGILEKALRALDLRGVKLHCHVLKIAPDDPVMFPVYEAVLEHDAILTIHAGREPAAEAYGTDVRAICGARRMEKVLRRYPDMKVIVPHMGIDETDVFFSLLDEFQNLYLDSTMILAGYFDISLPDKEKIIRYADRILYGSDYPHIPYEMDREVKALLSLELGEEATRKILCDNAARLFGLDSTSTPLPETGADPSHR
ncbi:MAG: amidohydrolase family protein [Thermodesulfobacteriota bacterium]